MLILSLDSSAVAGSVALCDGERLLCEYTVNLGNTHSETILPMTLVECKPIGMLNMIDGDSKDEKIIAVPLNDPNFSSFNDIKDLPKHMFEEIQHFFSVYQSLEHGKETTVSEVSGAKKARETIKKCIECYITDFQMA